MQRAESLAMCYVGDAMTVPTTGAPELGKPGPETGYPQLRSGWWASGGPGLCDGSTLFTELISLWLFKERDSTSVDTSYLMNYLKFVSGTFLIPVMPLISPKEAYLEASGASEGARQRAHPMCKLSCLLFWQHPGTGKTCVSSRWFQALGTHFWSLLLSSSPVYFH